MAIQPVFNTFNERPLSQGGRGSKTTARSTLRDNFTLTTWLLVGASLQGLITLLPYPNIALVSPVAMILLYQVGRTVLACLGLIPNHRMQGVISNRTTVIYPNEKTGEQERPGDKKVCAIILAMRCNHPLGMFGPGSKDVGEYFDKMSTELDKKAIEYGYLGSSRWAASGDRGFAGETMAIMYFESAEKVHEYAQGPVHAESTQWWMKTAKQLPHIGLMHEIIEAPKGHWEGLYLNYHPTGLGATSMQAGGGGQKVWVNPLVRATGPLLTSKYRMTGLRSSEKEGPELEEAMRVSREDEYSKA